MIVRPPHPAPPSSSNGSDIPLEIHDLTVAYHKKPVLWGIDILVPKASWSALSGPTEQASPR